MKILFVTLIAVLLMSCSSLQKVQEKGAGEIAKLIATYCLTTDNYYRTGLRNQVNEKLNGSATIVIDCKE